MIVIKVKKQLHSSTGPLDLNVEFEVAAGELISLFGQSGAGKTTILRMMAGLTEPDEGYIEVDGEVWFDSRNKINWPVQKRKIGFLFQEYHLFPNMTVIENLRYALTDKHDAGLIDELLKITHLIELGDRYPIHLSGGQKQRVALIRALLRRPKIFLLDEPFSALHYTLRAQLQNEILEIHKRFHIPTIIVSHDLSEVFKLSHRILLIEDGRVARSGEPHDLFFGQTVSGKFQFPGVILDITAEHENFIYIVTLQVGHNITKVVASENEIRNLRVGDKVLVAAKAFNPIILESANSFEK